MLILTGKSPLVILFIFLHLVNTITLAQPGFIAHTCNSTANYTRNSPYERNLDTTLSTLPNTNSGFGFFNSSTGQGSDTVHSVALCRGDVDLDACRSCLNDSIVRLRRICPDQTEAVGYYDYCMLKYSNQAILGNTQINFNYVNYINSENASDVDRFNGALSPLLNNLTREASTGGSLLKFATGNTPGPGLTYIYALVQCTPDLTQQQCYECLGDAITQFSIDYAGSFGGRILAPMCNFRYEDNLFYNENTPAIPPPSSGTNTSKTRTVIIVTISVTVSVIILITFICIFIRLRNTQQTPPSDNTETETMDIGTAEPLQYSFCTKKKHLQYSFSSVKAATNDFAKDNKLGQGGFGAVYKGKLENGEEIAVKRLAKDSGHGRKQFENEVLALTDLRHCNLVRLLGFSIEGSERLLIYEFLPNGSLDQFIFDPIKRTLLDWEKRYMIIKGIAKGLLYLHKDSGLRIIHRDMKASNVLLDAEMNPKIADFGLARLFKPDETQGVASIIAGTPGYMAPEIINWQISEKSDVFSFGVLVLEMVTGQKNTCFQNGESNLLSFAWNTWQNGTTLDMIDPTLKTGSGSLPDTTIRRCIHIGLLCVQENATDRPTMALVVHMLHRFSITLQVPSWPAFFMHSSSNPENKHSKLRSSQVSVNDVSLSEVVPR